MPEQLNPELESIEQEVQLARARTARTKEFKKDEEELRKQDEVRRLEFEEKRDTRYQAAGILGLIVLVSAAVMIAAATGGFGSPVLFAVLGSVVGTGFLASLGAYFSGKSQDKQINKMTEARAESMEAIKDIDVNSKQKIDNMIEISSKTKDAQFFNDQFDDYRNMIAEQIKAMFPKVDKGKVDALVSSRFAQNVTKIKQEWLKERDISKAINSINGGKFMENLLSEKTYSDIDKYIAAETNSIDNSLIKNKKSSIRVSSLDKAEFENYRVRAGDDYHGEDKKGEDARKQSNFERGRHIDGEGNYHSVNYPTTSNFPNAGTKGPSYTADPALQYFNQRQNIQGGAAQFNQSHTNGNGLNGQGY